MKRRIVSVLAPALFAAVILQACSSPEISDESKEAISDAEEVLQDAVTTAMSGVSDTAGLFKSGKDNIDDLLEKYDKDNIDDLLEKYDKDNIDGLLEKYDKVTKDYDGKAEDSSSKGILATTGDIELADTDGKGKDYTFYYAGDAFEAQYTDDNWKVIDSYRITNENDIRIICEALSDEHPIRSRDGASYRTPEDMAYEWVQHNIAYELLPDDSDWKDTTKDVDLNPEDQGKSFDEMYKDRTGRELTLDEIMDFLQIDQGDQ